MKLTDLEPAWLESAGQRVAIIFLCPHCFLQKRQWITCFFVASGSLPRNADGWRGDRELFKQFLASKGVPNPEEAAWDVVSCKPEMAWQRTSDSLDTISITPSIDASASGHWHGHITNGAIT